MSEACHSFNKAIPSTTAPKEKKRKKESLATLDGGGCGGRGALTTRLPAHILPDLAVELTGMLLHVLFPQVLDVGLARRD
jgi:hypothetical protein